MKFARKKHREAEPVEESTTTEAVQTSETSEWEYSLEVEGNAVDGYKGSLYVRKGRGSWNYVSTTVGGRHKTVEALESWAKSMADSDLKRRVTSVNESRTFKL